MVWNIRSFGIPFRPRRRFLVLLCIAILSATPASASASAGQVLRSGLGGNPTSAAAALAKLHLSPSLTLETGSWAGYVAGPWDGQTSFSSAWAVFQVPAVNCAYGSAPPFAAAAWWVGLDGATNGSLEQTGVIAECSNGQASYLPFLELIPYGPEIIPYPITPWETMAAAVYNEGGGHFETILQDRAGRGWEYDRQMYAGSNGWGATAEVVAEQPTCGSALCPLAYYDTQAFDSASVNGHAFWSDDATHAVCPYNGQETIGVGQLLGPYNAFFYTGWRQYCVAT